jgi:broad specificity polyphosphatase/5'/3'-nucleotidase SurE
MATTMTTCALAEVGMERAGKPVACARVGTETTGREDSTDMVVSGLDAKMW